MVNDSMVDFLEDTLLPLCFSFNSEKRDQWFDGDPLYKHREKHDYDYGQDEETSERKLCGQSDR